MNFTECEIAGAWLIESSPIRDERGAFMRAWCAREFADHAIPFNPVQANIAKSARRGTIRGLHYQAEPALEAKLVRCTRGSIFDLVLDMRPESETYLKWHGAILSESNARMLYVPEGCAHGCLSLEDDSEIFYLASAFYTRAAVRGVRFDDPAAAIDWPIDVVYVSPQDESWPRID